MDVYGGLVVVFLFCLAYHTYTDVKEQLLYDSVNAVLLVGGCIYTCLYGNLWQSLYGALMTGGAMLGLYFLSRGGMGEGDVKLAFVIGVWLSPLLGTVCLVLAFMSGGLVAAALLLLGIKEYGEKLSFGPFLCLGAIVAFLYGDSLISFYLSYF